MSNGAICAAPSSLLVIPSDFGENSLVFLARALLQHAVLVILDESFAAPDPENLKRSLECVKKRAKLLLVIAHR